MRQAFDDVKQFMQVGGQEVLDTPTMPEIPGDGSEFHDIASELEGMALRLKTLGGLGALRLRLIVEEVGELASAIAEGDAVEAADALADISYVTVGGALAFGLPLPEVWEAVQASNMTKFPPCPACKVDLADAMLLDESLYVQDAMHMLVDRKSCKTCGGLGRVAIKDANGKVLKPHGWTKPDIAKVLAASAKEA